MIDALIFDLDGTLADTLADITAAVNAGVEHLGLDPKEPSQVRQWVGDGLAKLIERALPPANHGRLAEATEVAAAYYRQHTMDHATLYPGIPDLLEALEETGLAMSVLSNKPHEFTVQIVGAMLSPWSISGALGCIESARKKPDPSGALSLAEHMGVSAGSIVLVGDSGTDIKTARNAGMRSVAVTWGFRDRDVLEAARPTWLIDKPAELLRIIHEEGDHSQGKGLTEMTPD